MDGYSLVRPFEELYTRPLFVAAIEIGVQLVCQLCRGPLPHYTKWQIAGDGPYCSGYCASRGDAASAYR